MTDIKNKTAPLTEAVRYLPLRIANAVCRFCTSDPEKASRVTEIHLRSGGALSLSISDRNLALDEYGRLSGKNALICTQADVDECADILCGSSYQSHKDELEMGYISSSGAFRAGVSTYSSYGGSVWGIDGICIRIPRDVPGCSKRLFELVGLCSMLICSPPGVGKTTLLRDIADRLCGEYRKRIVVCDPKYELLPQNKPLFAHYICGKPKADAIESAVRFMSAQVIICDELGNTEECRAVQSAQSGGVTLIATAHADSMESLLSRPNLKLLYDAGIFQKYVFLSRSGDSLSYTVREK